MRTLAQLEPRSPISSLPYTINMQGAYYLTTNLTGQAGTNGITITADNVSLDLNGFALTGVMGSIAAIRIDSAITHRNIAIHNGTICGWGAMGISGHLAEHLIIHDIMAYTNGTVGIAAGNGSLVTRCTSMGHSSSGFQLYSGSMITDCIARKNSGAGINLYWDNVAKENACYDNEKEGIKVSYGGNQVDANKVSYNQTGIRTDFASGVNLIVRNAASGNSTNYSLHATNAVGPIVSCAGSVITNTNPWANFSY
ncbi:MAG TPA: hypothetical protein DCZ95_10105 [Verrucomicrobia bacterium]|nr:hypothetical protein [Verrucomicrobiota bacterium]